MVEILKVSRRKIKETYTPCKIGECYFAQIHGIPYYQTQFSYLLLIHLLVKVMLFVTNWVYLKSLLVYDYPSICSIYNILFVLSLKQPSIYMTMRIELNLAKQRDNFIRIWCKLYIHFNAQLSSISCIYILMFN